MISLDLLPCQRDSYLREGQARVLSCESLQATNSGDERFKVVLSQSGCLYPEGGGQPGDRGRLCAADGKLLAEVIDVQRETDGSVAVYTNAPVSSEADVEVSVDWAHRFDLMQQHTGQHLLSAVCDEVAGADTISWELHPRPTSSDSSDSVCIDLAVPHLSSEQLQAIEERCNEVIRLGTAVNQVIVSNSNRQAVANSKLLRGALPQADKVSGPVRMIEIEGVDINACGGTHLHSTAEIQAIKIKSLERTKGMVRLRFVAGGRVLSAMSRFLLEEASLNKVLGCGLPEWTRSVQKIQADRRQLHKRISAYTAEVACTYAQSLLPQLLISNGWLHSHREDADAAFLSTVAAEIEKGSPGALTFLTGGNVPIPGRHHKPVDKIFLLSGPKDKVADLGPKIAEALGTKGGGRPGAFQGKLASLDKLPRALKILHENVQPSRTSIGGAPSGGSFVGTQPMIGSQPLIGSQPMPMLVPISAPAPLPPILPSVPSSSQLLANVELAEERLRQFNIMYGEQRKALLTNEEDAVSNYRHFVGDLPIRAIAPVNGHI